MKLVAYVVGSALLHLPFLGDEWEPPTAAVEIDDCTCCRGTPRHQPEYEPARPTALELAWPTVAGGLPRRVVRRFVRFHAHEIARCNHAQLDRVAITVELEIGLDGRATHVVARGGDGLVASCVASALRAIEFPVASEPTVAAFSMTLRPRVVLDYGTTSKDAALFVR